MHSPRAARARRGLAALTAIALLATLTGSTAAAPGGQSAPAVAGYTTGVDEYVRLEAGVAGSVEALIN